MSSFGMGRNVHSLTLSIPAFPLPTMASPTLQSAPKDGFEKAVVARDMPEPCEFPSLDSCQNFLWAHKNGDLAPHPLVGLNGVESLDPALKAGKQESKQH